MSVTILHEKCEPDAAQDRKLPNTAYLVEYKLEGKSTYDIAISQKAVDLFDHYYDKFKKDFVKFTQAEGRVNPKMWHPPGQEPQQKKRKRKTSS